MVPRPCCGVGGLVRSAGAFCWEQVGRSALSCLGRWTLFGASLAVGQQREQKFLLNPWAHEQCDITR